MIRGKIKLAGLAVILILGIFVLRSSSENLSGYLFSKNDLYLENLALKKESQDLRAQIQILASQDGAQKSDKNGSYLKAEIFSTYPFNTRNNITLDVGRNNNVSKSMVVLATANIFIGKISDVSENTSVVQTILDPNWQMPVRIGDAGVDGLYKGGVEPKITMIAKDKNIKTGDFVYSAGADLPYGLKVGEIDIVNDDPSRVLKEATVRTPFNINDLREVLILIVNK